MVPEEMLRATCVTMSHHMQTLSKPAKNPLLQMVFSFFDCLYILKLFRIPVALENNSNPQAGNSLYVLRMASYSSLSKRPVL